jgi:hypothetical protein
MLENIKAHEILSQFLEDDCCENNICVTFAEDIARENYIIIKVDKYYNSLGLAETPPSLDCLIIRRCLNTGFGLTLVELKDIDSTKRFTIENLKAKFETTINDFIQTRFNVLFIDYKRIELYFVSNIELYKGKWRREEKLDRGLKLEILINIRFKYGNRKLMIQPRMPDPTITNCH